MNGYELMDMHPFHSLVFVFAFLVNCKVSDALAEHYLQTSYLLVTSQVPVSWKRTLFPVFAAASDYPDPPTNLTVDLHALRVQNSIGIIATINWNALYDNRRRNYELLVTALSPQCQERFHHYHRSLSPNLTSFQLPSSTYQTITFGCTYNISLSSVLRNLTPGGQHTIHKLLNVDDCIGAVCPPCTKSLPSPPENLTFEADNEQQSDSYAVVAIRWMYSEHDTSALSFRIALFWQVLSSDGVDMLQRRATKHLFVNNTCTRYEVTFNISTNENYVVVVTAIDEFKCGVSVNRSVKVITRASQLGDAEHYLDVNVYIILVSGGGAVVALLIGGLLWNMWSKRPGGRRLTNSSAANVLLGYYRNSYSNSSLFTRESYLGGERQDVSLVSQHFNVNYVEKEIQEARDRGIADFYEVHHGRLMIGREIGKGAFGRVCIAKAESIVGIPGQIIVAVKYLRECYNEQEKEDFLTEISMMKTVGRHPHVVAMLGCCSLQEPFCMIMEYVAHGDLLNYLRKLRAEYERSTGILIGLSSCYKSRYSDQKLCQHAENSCVCDEKSEICRSSNISCRHSPFKFKCDYPPADEDFASRGHQQRYTTESPMKTTVQQFPSECSRENDVSTSSEATEKMALFVSGECDDNHLSHAASQLELSLNPLELQSFAMQIANGMNHLATRGIVHRDLAARNILIDRDRTLKISDFGLSRSGVYVTQRGGKVPLRWLSIEAIRDNVYSCKSDVWAFGVVLWEICTLGGHPYSNLSDKELYGCLVNGHRLEKPVNCTDELSRIWCIIWQHWRALLWSLLRGKREAATGAAIFWP